MKTKIFTIKLKNGNEIKVRTRKVITDTVYVENTEDSKEENEENSRRLFLSCQLCPYNKVCELIPNPDDPKDGDGSLAEFCSDNLVCDSDETFPDSNGREYDYIPVEGTWENNFPDLFLMKNLVKRDPLVRLSEVVNSVCADWCGSYKSDMSGCKNEDICILKRLFEK